MSEWIAGVENHLWQSTAFAAVAWGVTLLLRKNQARVRYGVWLAASLKFLVPFSLLIAVGGMLPRPQRAVAAPAVYTAMDEVALPFSDVAPEVDPTHAAMTPQHEWRTRVVGLLPAVLGVVWICGVVVVLAMWCVRWRQVRATLRRAVRMNAGRECELLRRLEVEMRERGSGPRLSARKPVALMLSQELMEPGIFGIFCPALIWPERLSERLDDEQISAILIHELAHARRRDNLTAALHMLVEAAFWFHPLVWWMERRMVEERERACDEAVVAMGSQPGIYAESLLKAVRFCVESPLTCVAGITGADLSKRVRSIMTLRLERMSWGRRAMLAAFGIVAIAAPIVLGQMTGVRKLTAVVLQAVPSPASGVPGAAMQDTKKPDPPQVSEAQAAPQPVTGAKVDLLGQGLGPVQTPHGHYTEWTNNFVDSTGEINLAAVPSGHYRVWMEQEVRWLITPTELAAFVRLQSNQERDSFIEHFWELHAKAAGLSPDAYRDLIYGRIAYSNEHFATNHSGYSTDRGHVYIAYGKPDEVPVHTDTEETWRYRHLPGLGDNVTIRFVSTGGVNNYRLATPLLASSQQAGAATQQSGGRTDHPLAFDVVSIKPAKPGSNGQDSDFADGRFVATNISLKNLMQYETYGMPAERILGWPAWVDSARFDIAARLDAASYERLKKLNPDQTQAAMRGLFEGMLAEQFKLKVHTDTQTLPVYALELAKGGPKFHAMAPGGEENSTSSHNRKLVAKGVTMQRLADTFTRIFGQQLGRLVIDKTGLEGSYDLTLDWSVPQDTAASAQSDLGAAIFSALSDQLGLKLVSTKAPVDVLVIDHAELPAMN